MDAQNEIQLLARFLFMAGLFVVFLVEKCAACQSYRKSDFGKINFTHFLLLNAYYKGFKKVSSDSDGLQELHLDW